MRISVITPVYNGANYIGETVLSVLKAADGYDVEYIVVDDGSTDETSSILQEFGSRIKLVTQNNGGESRAVNEGIRNATGDFILVVSADDPLFTPKIFDGVESFFDTNPDIVVWYPNWNMIDQDGNKIKTVWVDEFSLDRLLGRFVCLPGPGTFIRKAEALKIRGRNVKWKYVGDYDFWLRIAQLGSFQKRDEVLAQWRFHKESTSISKRGPEMMREQISVIEEFVTTHNLTSRMIRMSRAHSHYYASITAFQFNYMLGVKTLIRAFLIRGFLSNDFKFKTITYLLFYPLITKGSKSLKKLLFFNKGEI
jgi:glycosyltransferase involved in cell wall biosynthesis